jgi:hypothetical protein
LIKIEKKRNERKGIEGEMKNGEDIIELRKE